MDIDGWLRGIGLAQYAEIFRANDIDGELLGRLTNDDLKDIGVASFGHRKKLLDIGIAQNLKSALGQYAGHGSEQVGIDEGEAVRVLVEKYEIVRAMFRPDTKGGFDYRPVLSAATTPQMRLAIMAGAIDWVLTFQQADAANETTEEGKKRVHRR